MSPGMPTGKKFRTSQLRRRAVLTALDFTRGQSITQLMARLELSYCTVMKYLATLEKDGYAKATPVARGNLWYRTDVP